MDNLDGFEKIETSAKQTQSKFLCPGCGEKATAIDSDFCRTCRAFVHIDCQKLGFLCPICLEDTSY